MRCKSYMEASEKNWELLVNIFKDSKNFKLIKPKAYPNQRNKKNTCEDGILITTKGDRKIIILVEVKRREFTMAKLNNELYSTVFLQKTKCISLHKKVEMYKKNHPDAEFRIWYLTETSDGYYFIHDIYNVDIAYVKIPMNKVTYTANQEKVKKDIALLHIRESIFNGHIK